jgi:hypothetical protein
MFKGSNTCLHLYGTNEIGSTQKSQKTMNKNKDIDL